MSVPEAPLDGSGGRSTPDDEALPGSLLVVDDNASSRAFVAEALRRADYAVVEARNVAEALRVVEAQRIDLVVTDLRMPGDSGIDLISTLRRRPESATMPLLLMTGSGDEKTVIAGLAAGADDFLEKPVRLDELVARVRAHLRTQAAWSKVVADELGIRTRVVEALGRLRISSDPEEAAEAVVRELAERAHPDFAAVLQLVGGDHLQELATYTPTEGVRRDGLPLPSETAAQLIERAKAGPWVEDLGRRVTGPGTSSFERADLSLYASAPIHAGSELVGILSLGVSGTGDRASPARAARLLASASDYSAVLSAVAGRAIANRRDAAVIRARLEHALVSNAFHPVFQPIVDLDSAAVVGYEALTRFDDGVPPNRRFEEAAAAGLGIDYELAAIARAIEASTPLPADVFLSVNISPTTVVEAAGELATIVGSVRRRLLLELTEHLPIDDYGRLRGSLARLRGVGLAVDDAGAGYSSLRHILELRPTFAKLDISLVRGIDGDDLRQSMAAGLEYFADRTGCSLVAEGVETQAEAETLLRLGVEFGQGYLFGRPEPLTD